MGCAEGFADTMCIQIGRLKQYSKMFRLLITFTIIAVLQIRKGNGDNLVIIFLITPLKHTLRPIIRTVSSRRF